jgi:hypothetical protein
MYAHRKKRTVINNISILTGERVREFLVGDFFESNHQKPNEPLFKRDRKWIIYQCS